MNISMNPEFFISPGSAMLQFGKSNMRRPPVSRHASLKVQPKS
jgi:hypothetical protein